MTERYPDDATLLAMEQDPDTGIEYITTGQSPYYLQFRRLIQRLVLATTRANDFRVYQDGDLSVGVRPGRCVIGADPVAFAGTSGVAVSNNAVTHVWLDADGEIATGTSGLPEDRTGFIPLAEVTAAAGSITSITDLRGELMWGVPDLTLLGVSASAGEISQALDGINGSVIAAALNTLTGGPQSTADELHRHLQITADDDSAVTFTLLNSSSGSAANMAIRFDVPNQLGGPVDLYPHIEHGYLMQSYLGGAYALVGTIHPQYTHSGDFTASQSGRVIGAVPINGVIIDVILTIGRNIESSAGADGLTAIVKVNGTDVATTNPSILSEDGAGFRCTAQMDGTPAEIKSDGTEQVTRGDLLTVDLTLTDAGTVSVDLADVAVMVVIAPDTPA